METYLNVQDFSCGYADFKLSHINFALKKGTLAGIIGPNGSGKTTLFKGLSGVLDSQTGSVTLSNKNILKMKLKEKAQNIAIVSQFTEQADIPVQDYVLMGRFPYRGNFQFFDSQSDVDIAIKYMKLTGVYSYKDKLLSELSGGEQQLAAVARALTQEPRLLLLDEPTSHLDITHQVQVLNLIQRLNHELDLTVLMIIHDLNLAGEYCDYLLMMNEGKMHTQGTPEEVLTYANIETVYNTVVVTQQNPLSKKTAIFLVSEKVLEQNKKNKQQNG